MIKLYQFPISHFCEKVRWVMDHKGLTYERINLVPGPHFLTTKRLAPETWVPIIVDGKKVIQESSKIVDYLETAYSQSPVTPKLQASRKDALEMEHKLDQEIGVHLRRLFYNTLLKHRSLVISLLTQDASGMAKRFYPAIFPLIKKVMIMGMRINNDSALRSRDRLIKVMESLNRRLNLNPYLFGNSFTRVDITAASLLAPLCQPPEHEFQWPAEIPEPLATFRQEQETQPIYQWVLRMYREHR